MKKMKKGRTYLEPVQGKKTDYFQRDLNVIEWMPLFYDLVVSKVKANDTTVLYDGHLKRYVDKLFVDGDILKVRDGENIYTIVRTDRRDAVLRQLYTNPLTTGNSRDSLYSNVMNSNYLGISRRYVQEWLKQQEAYQVHLPVLQPKNTTVMVTKAPNQLWQVDITYLTKYKPQNFGYKYILSVVDHFSKCAWVVPLTNKKAATTAIALKQIIKDENTNYTDHIKLNGRKPKRIQSDRGKEFMAEFSSMCEALGIEQSFSYAYTPQAQGAVEAFNRSIKRMIASLMTTNGDFKWVEKVKELTRNYNYRVHSTTRMAPAVLFNTSDTQIIEMEHKRSLQRKEIANKGIKSTINPSMTKTYNKKDKIERVADDLMVNDIVRISKWAWNPDNDADEDENYVKKKKSGVGAKKYLANWTKAVFRVVKKGKRKNYSGSEEVQYGYVLKKIGGDVLTGRIFYRHDLLKIASAFDKEGNQVDYGKYDANDITDYIQNNPRQERKKTLKKYANLLHLLGMHIYRKSGDGFFDQGVIFGFATVNGRISFKIATSNGKTVKTYQLSEIKSKRHKLYQIMIKNGGDVVDEYMGPIEKQPEKEEITG
jgi:transposase InsO family protein